MNPDLSSSLSTQLQMRLTKWRNPQGEEINWINKTDEYTKFPRVWTIVKCEGAYAALAGMAGCEYSTSMILFPFGYALSCISNRPLKAINHWAECSKIAALWAWTNLSSNVTKPNMATTPEYFLVEQNQKNILRHPLTLSGAAPLGD